jgi:hypothetical protein
VDAVLVEVEVVLAGKSCGAVAALVKATTTAMAAVVFAATTAVHYDLIDSSRSHLLNEYSRLFWLLQLLLIVMFNLVIENQIQFFSPIFRLLPV